MNLIVNVFFLFFLQTTYSKGLILGVFTDEMDETKYNDIGTFKHIKGRVNIKK